ncbi:MAG TPA: hypothetical protein VFH85_07720 [Gammaproteobacteria bacterium]|nr:hypothetical protein [Gammaproteobacteria bacterium]
MGDVVKLIDTCRGIAVDDETALGQWAMDWCEAFRDGDSGALRSIVIVVEGKNGTVATVTQGLGPMDGCRQVGLLMHVTHRKLDGKADIEEFHGGD